MNFSSLAKLRSKRVYSVEGNIGAGKTTLLKLIGKNCKDIHFVEEPVSRWENLGGESLLKKFYEDPLRWGYSFEFYAMFSKLEALLKSATTDKPIIIIERSLISSKAFFEVSSNLGKLDSMEYHMLLNIHEFFLKNLYPVLSGIIYLKTPIDECVKRIKNRSRKGEEEIDRRYLSVVEEKFDRYIQSSGIPTLDVDGLYDITQNGTQVANQIDDFMHQRTPKVISQ